jgi:fatty acid desaturase
MPLRKLPLSDKEYVERVRRSILWYDRFRWLMVVFYLAATAALVSLGFILIDFVLRGPMPGAWAGFAFGGLLGLLLGKLTHKVGHGLAQALDGANRSERLLVRYYDALWNLGIENIDEEEFDK